MSLDGMRVAVLAADGFEQLELTRPVRRLRKAGAEVEIVSLRPGSIRGTNLHLPGKKVRVDRTVYRARPEQFDALYIPGGFVSPDLLRQEERVLDFVRAFEDAGKPIAAMCHGPWVLISAGLVDGRRLASWPGIRDDVENAGGEWVDKAVVRDGNWVTSRDPRDLRKFGRAILVHFARRVPPASQRGSYSPPRRRGRWAAALVLLAAGGYALSRLGRQEPAPEPSGADDEAHMRFA